MKYILAIPVLLVALGVCTFLQSEWVDTMKITQWSEAPDIEITDREIYFKPEKSMGKSMRQSPMIKLHLYFKNKGSKPIKSVTFDILLFDTNRESPNEPIRVKVKPFVYDSGVLPYKTGSILYEPSFETLILPVKQEVFVSQIEYTDGTFWERNNTQVKVD